MPRNSQGLYTLPAGNPVVPNTLIESAWANGTMDDIASALTASLPRDGSAPMVGPLTLQAGPPTGARHATTKEYVDSFMAFATGMPVGAVFAFASAAAPAGFLLCNGQAVSRTTYADLFTAIGTTFGAGDNTTTFNVPDMRDWFARGRGTSRALGSTQEGSLGSHTHPLVDTGHNHLASQDAHNHNLTTGGHNHAVTDPGHFHQATIYAHNDNGPLLGNANGGVSGTMTTDSKTTGIALAAVGDLGGTADTRQPAVYTQSNTSGVSIGAAGGTETRPQNIAFDYYIKAVNDSAGAPNITSITTSDDNMISVDNALANSPELIIHSNVAFGIPKLDANGKILLAQLPQGASVLLGYFDASAGQNPSQAHPATNYSNGEMYIVSVGGNIQVRNPATGVESLTAVAVGGTLLYLEGQSQPDGWYYSIPVAADSAANISFLPGGTISATNVQQAIEELDLETQVGLSTKAPLSAGTAAGTSFTPTGSIVANNVQDAIMEVVAETASLSNANPAMNGAVNPGVATAASRDDHVHPTDTSRAPTSAMTAVGTSFAPSGTVAATNVQAAIQELDTEKVARGPAFTGFQAGPTGAGFALTVLTDIVASFNPTSAWNPTTDRFQPNVAGLYQINFRVTGTGSLALTYVGAVIRLNGGGSQAAQYVQPFGTGLYGQPSVSCIFRMNGTTDYIQFLVDAAGSGGSLTWADATVSACLVRPD